jgi:predicted nucleotidyltransferase component of viral defense system
MPNQYPETFATLRTWAAENGVPLGETRVRFAQYGVLRAIASSRELGALLVFKGGNALDFIWEANRSTRDLDFSVDMSVPSAALSADHLRSLLVPALEATTRLLGIAYRIHRIEQQPPGEGKTFITYEARIGYALPDEAQLRQRLAIGNPSPHVIPLEVSLNEPICAAALVPIDPTHHLRVCTLEDIVAEKLRALLQQPIRNRTRRQDLLDIAVIRRTHPELDRERVGRFLIEKARARAVPVSRAAFRDPQVAERARQDYAALQSTTRRVFLPFEEALGELDALVASLAIPDI